MAAEYFDTHLPLQSALDLPNFVDLKRGHHIVVINVSHNHNFSSYQDYCRIILNFGIILDSVSNNLPQTHHLHILQLICQY